MMSDRRDELRKNRESLNARVGRPGTNAIGIILRKFPTKPTKKGTDKTKFAVLIGHTEPLDAGSDVLESSTGALVMHGEYKAEGQDSIPCEMRIEPYSVQQPSAWSAMRDVRVGDVVEIKALRLRCWRPEGTNRISLFLNCDRVESKGGSGQFKLVYDMLSQADITVKSVKAPALLSDEEIEYLNDLTKKAREGNFTFDSDSYIEGVSKWGDFMLVPIRGTTEAEFKEGVVNGFLLGAVYDTGEKNDWLWKKDDNSPTEMCMGVQVFGSIIQNADFSKRKEFFFAIRAYKDQLLSFGLTDKGLWYDVMRHHVQMMEILCMANVNNVATSRNEQNQKMLGTDPMVDEGSSASTDAEKQDEKIRFMYSLQAKQMVIDAPKEYKRIGIQVSFDWVVKCLGLNPSNRELAYTKGNKQAPPSADVICVEEYYGDLRELQKKASAFVVLTTYVVDSREIIPDYVKVMDAMGQDCRDRLAKLLLTTRKDKIKQLCKKDKDLSAFTDFASKCGEGNGRCIFAIMEPPDKKSRDAQTDFRAAIVDRFLGHTATTDGQAASRSAKRPRTPARSQVH